MMKIKLTQDVPLNNIVKKKGKEIEVSNELGKKLINKGKAISLSGNSSTKSFKTKGK